MLTLHSHTHCQVAPANPQAKTWQRVCLSNRTTNRQSGRKGEQRNANSVYVAIAGEVVNRRSILLRNFVLNGQVSASNPLLHIHAKRYLQAKATT